MTPFFIEELKWNFSEFLSFLVYFSERDFLGEFIGVYGEMKTMTCLRRILCSSYG
jgi:hypothetical protein